MIIFFEHGRLGNQMFQYAAFRHFYPEEQILFLGGEGIQRTITPVKALLVSRPKNLLWDICLAILQRLVVTLVHFRIVSSIAEEKDETSYILIRRYGLLNRVCIPKNTYFQHHYVIDRLEIDFKIKQELVEMAKDWLRTKNVSPDHDSLVFVHIRRGDFLEWPDRSAPGVLNSAWYNKAMDWMAENTDNPLYLVITDDYQYAIDFWGNRSDVIISDNNQYVDLALMSLCHNGILSASTFAWWGAYFSRLSKLENNHPLYLAPKYWAGHRRCQWYPKGFVTSWITYI